jgi:anti-anti-sigma factor
LAFSPQIEGQEMLGALGDIDRATAPAFGADLRAAIDSSDNGDVSVDCSGVTFMDSAGYRVLVDATNYAIRRGHTLVIRNLSPPCAMLIRLCDVNGELHVDPSTAEQAVARTLTSDRVSAT